MGGSEDVYGINLWPGEKVSSYAFQPDLNFLEFIPESEIEEENPSTIESNQLEVNKIYEIILTSHSGLYRYRVGDLIQIKEFVANEPGFGIYIYIYIYI